MKSKILQIQNTSGKIAYNPTIPFKEREKTYMGIRVESLDSELDSRICFTYRLSDDTWEIDDYSPSLSLQDPSYTKINNELFLLGVKVQSDGKNIMWNQEFYRGDSVRTLEYFASGPIGMKDIRLVDLEDRIGVFTRPQGNIWGLGKVGYLEIERINELTKLTTSDWYSAQLIDGLFEDGTWGGVNQAIALPNREIGIIGHKAYQEIDKNELIKHYYAISFKFNPQSNSVSNPKIIARRVDFLPSLSKRGPELDDIIFPAGIDEKNNLYCGLSDYCIGVKEIKNPF